MSRIRSWLVRRWGAVVVAAVLTAGATAVAAHGEGFEDSRIRLSDGGAWLASPQQGLVTLINGAAQQVVGSVRAPGARRGDPLSVVQSQASAYVVNGAQGTVARVDGATYDVSDPYQFGEGGASPLSVYAGGQALYVVDSQRRTASVTDPVSLQVRRQLPLAARPGPDQSVVDAAGRLWVVDQERGGLTWFDPDKRVRPEGAGANARLVLVQGRPVVVDVDRARLGALSGKGEVREWSCLDVRSGDQVQLLGSQSSGRVFATIPGTGTLVAGTVGRDGCELSVGVGKAGDRLGSLVESDRFVFVPNRTSGRTVVVDVDAGRVAADLPVVRAGSRLELLAKDGFVFYNDLDGDQAGVIAFEGGRWRVGRSLKKYDASDTGKGILTPSGSGDSQEGKNPAKKEPPAGKEPTDERDEPGSSDRGAGNPEPGPGESDPRAGNPDPGPESPGPDPADPSPDPADPSPDPVDPSPDPEDPSPGPGEPVALTVQVTGGGMVSAEDPAPIGLPAFVACTDTCVWRYPPNTRVVLGAPPTSGGKTFGGFTGCDRVSNPSGSHRCELTLTGPATVRAAYNTPPPQDKFLLTARLQGAGTLTARPAGQLSQRCDPTCSIEVVRGTQVTLEADPDVGNEINGWTNAPACGDDLTCTVTVNGDLTVTARFAAMPRLTVTTTGPGSVTGEGISCPSTCTKSVARNTTITLTARPGTNAVFTGWGDACSTRGTASTCSVTMNSGKSVSATFARLVTLTISVSGPGQVNGEGFSCSRVCERSFPLGTRVSLRAEPDSGNAEPRWRGACTGDGRSCTVTMDGDKEVSAQFPNVSGLTAGLAELPTPSREVRLSRIATVRHGRRRDGARW